MTFRRLHPLQAVKKKYFYRNKMEFSFSDSRWLTEEELNSDIEFEDKNACGFHIPGMWDKILDVKKCHLQEDPSNSIRNSVRKFAIENDISFFNPRHKTGLLRTLMVRISSTGEIMLVIQFFKEDKEKRELLLNYIAENFKEVTSLQYIINEKGNDSIYDQDIILFKGRDHIFEEMEGLQFKINAKSFYQTNSVQAYELYKIARDFAGLTGDEIVYDLYTGTGTIAQFIASKAKKVIGVEAVPQAIEDAKENARLNGIDNTVFYDGDMAKVFTQDFIDQNGHPQLIITDPPRDGMHQKVVKQILNILPEKVVYISCNSATQARDLALMKEAYTVEKISGCRYVSSDASCRKCGSFKAEKSVMKNIFKLITILFLIITQLSCERDEICLEDITPKLILRFYNENNQNEIKSVIGLKVNIEGIDGDYSNETINHTYRFNCDPTKSSGKQNPVYSYVTRRWKRRCC